MQYHNYWILFTAKGELAVDEHGVAMRSHLDTSVNSWDEKNPQDAPHVAVEYMPVQNHFEQRKLLANEIASLFEDESKGK